MLTVHENDLELADGRTTLHYYLATATAAEDEAPGAASSDLLPVFWSHGTPNTGEPPAPLFADAAALGIRLISYDRPGYGPSTRVPGRDVGSAAEAVAAVADALGIDEFALLGHSGGGPHVLGVAAKLPERVRAVVSMSGLAPYTAAEAGLDYFAGINANGVAELKAAAQGAETLERVLATGEYDPEMFTPKDHEALEGDWAWLAGIAGKALDGGIEGMVDDDVAYMSPWGFELGAVQAETLLVHGDQDRVVPVAHAHWLAGSLPRAELRVCPGDGHVSVLAAAGRQALEWLVETAR
jgi:pimeloyl-ACP methyl ester carboxylesterase